MKRDDLNEVLESKQTKRRELAFDHDEIEKNYN
jgi:hypothetical protein